MPGILEGIKVIDWTVHQVGPFAAAMLADMGADVIHLEMRGRGDILRGLTTSNTRANRDGRHIHFEEHNRNKRGIQLDLNKPEGKEIVYRLVETADVFMTNLRPDAAEKHGMTYEHLKAHNPKIISAVATSFGRRGPDAHLPAVDSIGMARSGMMMASGFEGDPPTPISMGTGDRTTAFLLAHGILGALLARERFGIAQEVHTSMLGACLTVHGFTALAPLLLDTEYPRAQPPGKAAPTTAPMGTALYNCYECKDGRWITISLHRDDHFEQFCQMVGDPALANDPRFATVDLRRANAREYAQVLTDAFATKTAQEWHALVRERAKDVMFSIVNRTGELLDDEQVTLNNYIMDWDHPAWGPVKWIGFPVDWSETPATLRMAAPELGQHTEEVLLELGYTWEDITRFQDLEVI